MVSVRVDNLVRSLGRTGFAIDVVDAAAAVVTDRAACDRLAAKRAFALHMAGRLAEALAVLEPLLVDAESPGFLPACYTGAACLVRAGRLSAATSVLDRADDALAGAGAVVADPSMAPSLGAVRCAALVGRGALRDAERLAAEHYADALERGSIAVQAVFAQILSRVHLAVGNVIAAAHSAREARSLFRDHQFRNPARTALTYLAQAEALAGSTETARAALAELAAMGLPTEALNAVELGRARGWVEVAAGNLAAAHDYFRDSALLARDQGDVVWESDALHDLARLGWAGEAEPRLRELSTQIEGELSVARARHAAALLASDAEELCAISVAFAAMGATLVAAEVAAASAVVLRRQGDGRRAAASELRAADLARRCQGATTPPLRAIETQALLSAREIEVAALAATGLANKEIASKLMVSVRTVENHLQRVYDKLGVARRADLTQALSSV